MIYYFAFKSPETGGDFVNIEHVLALQQMGLAAAMAYPGERRNWPGLPANAQALADIRFTAEDFLVIPEDEPAVFQLATRLPARIIIHNQNPFYLLQAVRALNQLHATRFDRMICPSQFSADMTRQCGYRGELAVIRPALPDYFVPRQKRLAIAFSPRKRPVEAAAVQTVFRSLYPEYAAIEWLPLSGMTRPAVAEILGDAAIYAAFAHLESLGLSVLEAMQCGCLVVGDHGGGGSEYARSDNGHWLAADDVVTFAHRLADFVRMFLTEGSDNALSRAARQATAAFSQAAFTAQLAAFWQEQLKHGA